MTFGEKIKQLRQQKSLSQPELANLAGIEQSYLSKIENDKSLPSNDILRKLLAAFELTLAELIDDQLVKTDGTRLKQIPDIESYLASMQINKFVARRRYLTISSALIVLAVTLFFAGFSKLIFSEIIYPYASQGIVKQDEPLTIFHDWEEFEEPLHLYANNKELFLQKTKEFEAKKLAMAKRRLVDTISSPIYLGREFVKQVEGGQRAYYLLNSEGKRIERPINAWLQVIGVMLFMMGIMGFVLERKLFKGTL